MLTELARSIRFHRGLEELLQQIVECAAAMLGIERASIRLLDPSRTRLMAVCRAGQPLHLGPSVEFTVGDGLMGWIVEHGRCIRTGDAEGDERFVPKPGMQGPMGSFLGVPLSADDGCLGVISAVHPENDYFTLVHEQLVTLLAAICAPHVELARLSRIANVDPLTEALNRRGLDAIFPVLPDDDVSMGVSVVMVDLDHFKDINDEHGHAMGDQVLREVGALLRQALRARDAAIRYGGEEFLLVLPEVGVAVAARIAERLRERIEVAEIRLDQQSVRVTASFGVAAQARGEDRDALIGRADAALYRAKSRGRNRVEIATE